MATRQEFTDWAYGMFIHFGLYSLHGRGEWVIYRERLNLDDYFKVQPDFQPKAGCAREWVRLAKESGMKYAVLTTRHHDGFFIGDALVREFCDACREFGLGVGLYYSVLNWADPDFFSAPGTPAWARFVEKTHRQLKELMTGYGPVDYLFYDGCPPPEQWDACRLHKELRHLQPGLLISCRCSLAEDVYSSEDNMRSFPGKAWESCYTMFNGSWGYNRFARDWRSADDIVHILTTVRHGGGNLLLNIGPMPDGSVRAEERKLLAEVGAWLKKNGEAVYGTIGDPLNGCDYELSTGNGSNLYFALVMDYPEPPRIITGIANPVKQVILLDTGKPIAFRQEGDKVHLTGLPPIRPGELRRVVKIVVEGVPRGIPNPYRRSETRIN